jgi:hypothetical protein
MSITLLYCVGVVTYLATMQYKRSTACSLGNVFFFHKECSGIGTDFSALCLLADCAIVYAQNETVILFMEEDSCNR